MTYVAIYTIGRLKHAKEHPATRKILEVGYEVVREANRSGNLIKEFSPYAVAFAEHMIPGEVTPILTLTVWKSLQSVYEFTYSGHHRLALKDRNHWIETPRDKKPTYVVWWTEIVNDVSWEEA